MVHRNRNLRTDDDHSYFISRLFVQEAFLKEENTQAGTEKELKRSQKKEPKKSRKKAGCITANGRKSDDNSG